MPPKRAPLKKPVPLGDLIHQFLHEHRPASADRLSRILDVWTAAVGESIARNAKPDGRAKQHPSMTSTPLTFDEWLANGQLPMQQAALADLEAGNDSDVLREVRKIYDETQGGNQ